MRRMSPRSSFVSDWKSAAPSFCSLNCHAPSGVFGGIVTVPMQMFGSVTPPTGFIVIGAVGNGACGTSTKLTPLGHETVNTVNDVTLIVLPRVHGGNFAGEMVSFST